MDFVFIVTGLILLVIGGEFLVRCSVGLSFKLNLSKIVIGLTVVSFATSAPELLVSIQAALDGHSSIAIGNVIGSNIANIGLVLGITALIAPLQVDNDFLKLHLPAMLLFSIALYGFLATGNTISSIEAGALVAGIVLFLIILLRSVKQKTATTDHENLEASCEEVDDSLQDVSLFKIIIWLLIGGLSLYYGSELLVNGAVNVAKDFGISDRIIAVTMIAIGTSIPELAASVIAAFKQEKSISIGNLIGSNIFNIGSVIGITGLIQPIALDTYKILNVDILWMLSFAFILLPLTLIPKKFEISRSKGLLIFGAYVVFIATTFMN